MKYQITIDDEVVDVDIAYVPTGGFDVRVGQQRLEVCEHALEEGACVIVNGQVFDMVLGRTAFGWHLQCGQYRGLIKVLDEIEQMRACDRTEPFEVVPNSGIMSSPVAGTIVKVMAKPGEVVKRGNVLIVIETMKMENELKASTDATVTQVHVGVGDRVEAGTALVQFESNLASGT